MSKNYSVTAASLSFFTAFGDSSEPYLVISISIIIFHFHIRKLSLPRIIIRRSFWPSISPISARVFNIFPLVEANGLRRIPATSVIVEVWLPHLCLLLKLRLPHRGVPQIWVSLRSCSIPFVWKQKLILNIMDASVGVVKIFDSFSLLGYLLLIVIGLLSYARKKFVYVLQRLSTGLDIFNSFARINPISVHLAGVNLSVVFLSYIIFVADEDYRHHILVVLTAVDICASYAVQEVISPLFNTLIAVPICYIECDHAAISASVKCVW
mgnify:CR=1 FL=1